MKTTRSCICFSTTVILASHHFLLVFVSILLIMGVGQEAEMLHITGPKPIGRPWLGNVPKSRRQEPFSTF